MKVSENGITLTPEEIASLEAPYRPHPLSGVMAQNTPAARNVEHVWTTNGKYVK